MANPNPSPGTRFKVGTTGNSLGRPRLSEDLREIRAMGADDVRRTFAKYARMTRGELENTVSSQDTPMLDLAICSILTKTVQFGDHGRLCFLLDRTIGRAPQQRDLEADTESQIRAELMGLSDEQLAERAAKAFPELLKLQSGTSGS